MKWFYLDGEQISEACAQRWEASGWIELVEYVFDEHHYFYYVTNKTIH